MIMRVSRVIVYSRATAIDSRSKSFDSYTASEFAGDIVYVKPTSDSSTVMIMIMRLD